MMGSHNESDWSQPYDTYVDVDGDSVKVPEIDPSTMFAILNGGYENIRNTHNTLKWLKSLKDKEVEAGYQFYTDRWTWDSGHSIDRFLSRVLEAEYKRRKELMATLDYIWTKEPMRSKITKILDSIATEQEKQKKGDGSAE